MVHFVSIEVIAVTLLKPLYKFSRNVITIDFLKQARFYVGAGGNYPLPRFCPQCDMKLFDELKASAKEAFCGLQNMLKCVFGRASALDPAVGAHEAPQSR